jgi:outer membrane protein assembly factor BamB
VGDRIFAMIWRRATSHLVALDRRDGTILWESAPIGRMTRSIAAHAAYDAGRLFATETQAVRAFDATTGAELWKHVFPEMGAELGPPSAAGGFVFVGRHTGHGELAALDGATGALLWDRTRDGMWDVSAPVVTASAVYIDSCCDNVFAFHPRSGRFLWETNVNLHGAGWNVLSVYQGRVYNRGGRGQPKPPGQIIDAMSGENLGSFRSLTAPAFHDGIAFFVDQGILSATDLASGAVRWVFRGDGMINTAPLVVDGRVYVGSSGGTLYALDGVSGANAWSESVTELSPSTDSPSFYGGVFTGFNAARSTLVITGSRNIITYGGAP